MKLMDEAAAVAAARHCHANVVTARVDGIIFFRPLMVGNLVIAEACLTFVSRSTMDVRVEVIFKEEQHHALTAHFFMVAVDEDGKPIAVPPLIISTEKEKKFWDSGKSRHSSCREDLMMADNDYSVCREEALF